MTAIIKKMIIDRDRHFCLIYLINLNSKCVSRE